MVAGPSQRPPPAIDPRRSWALLNRECWLGPAQSITPLPPACPSDHSAAAANCPTPRRPGIRPSAPPMLRFRLRRQWATLPLARAEPRTDDLNISLGRLAVPVEACRPFLAQWPGLMRVERYLRRMVTSISTGKNCRYRQAAAAAQATFDGISSSRGVALCAPGRSGGSRLGRPLDGGPYPYAGNGQEGLGRAATVNARGGGDGGQCRRAA